MERVKENCFEFIEGQSMCTATLSAKKFINRIKKVFGLSAEKESRLTEILKRKKALEEELPTLGFFKMKRKKEVNQELSEIPSLIRKTEDEFSDKIKKVDK